MIIKAMKGMNDFGLQRCINLKTDKWRKGEVVLFEGKGRESSGWGRGEDLMGIGVAVMFVCSVLQGSNYTTELFGQ